MKWKSDFLPQQSEILVIPLNNSQDKEQGNRAQVGNLVHTETRGHVCEWKAFSL